MLSPALGVKALFVMTSPPAFELANKTVHPIMCPQSFSLLAQIARENGVL
jgi:hypothetical protein